MKTFEGNIETIETTPLSTYINKYVGWANAGQKKSSNSERQIEEMINT